MMTNDEVVNAIAVAHAKGHEDGVADERERWRAALAAERDTWSEADVPPERCLGAVSLFRGVLRRLGIAQ